MLPSLYLQVEKEKETLEIETKFATDLLLDTRG
jgi:hypothetical protein